MKASSRTIVIISAVLLFSSSMLPARAAENAPERADQLKKLVSAAWWNNPAKVKDLGLTPNQRTRMNDELATYLEAITSLKPQEGITTKLNDALVAGSWDNARELAKELAAGRTDRTLQRSNLKITIMSLLAGEQREFFAKEYPRLLERQWPQSPSPKNRQNKTDTKKRGDENA